MHAHVVYDEAESFIIGTESGIIHTLPQAAIHNKKLIRAPVVAEATGCHTRGECPHMKLTSIEKIHHTPQNLKPRSEMSDELSEAARLPLERMLAVP